MIRFINKSIMIYNMYCETNNINTKNYIIFIKIIKNIWFII